MRADYAPFDVQVIWDNRGVNSPFFNKNNGDTVAMITSNQGSSIGKPNLTGIAPRDQNQGNAQRSSDVALVFGGSIASLPTLAGQPRLLLRQLTQVASHEAAHTFGVQHSTSADSASRQIMGDGFTVFNNRELDSRFSTTVGNGSITEFARLTQTLGAAPSASSDAQTGQTLAQDTLLIQSNSAAAVAVNGQIDFLGDRDAFRFVSPVTGQFTVQMSAAGSTVDPIVTVWDSNGNFVAVGNQGAAGGTSTATFAAQSGTTYFAVAGSGYDRVANVPSGSKGSYQLAIGPSGASGFSNPATATATQPGPVAPQTSPDETVGDDDTGSASAGSSPSAPASSSSNPSMQALNDQVIANLKAVFAQPIPPGSNIKSASITSIADLNGDGFADVSASILVAGPKGTVRTFLLFFNGVSPNFELVSPPVIIG